MMNLVETQPVAERRTAYSLAPDVTGFNILFVNYYTIGDPEGEGDWWLVDAGLPGSTRMIRKETKKLFGANNPPRGIILTHGHFDHVGALKGLLKEWPDTRVFAHPKEIPYLTGQASYPPPDPAAGAGAMSGMSWLFPTRPLKLKGRVYPLNEGTEIPGLPEWTFIHTPGHSPGHISLFRKRDRTLIAGDAFVTTNQNSLYSALTQMREMHAPPAYFTINWSMAKESLRKLIELEPEAAGTGHGLPFFGEELRREMRSLLEHFDQKELPPNGHYVKHPVVYSDGKGEPARAPKSYRLATSVSMAAVLAAAGGGLAWLMRKNTKAQTPEEQAEESSI